MRYTFPYRTEVGTESSVSIFRSSQSIVFSLMAVCAGGEARGRRGQHDARARDVHGGGDAGSWGGGGASRHREHRPQRALLPLPRDPHHPGGGDRQSHRCSVEGSRLGARPLRPKDRGSSSRFMVCVCAFVCTRRAALLRRRSVLSTPYLCAHKVTILIDAEASQDLIPKFSRGRCHACPSSHLDHTPLWQSDRSRTGLERKLLLLVYMPPGDWCIQGALRDRLTNNRVIAK